MPYCRKCGEEIPPNSKYCLYCRAEQASIAPVPAVAPPARSRNKKRDLLGIAAIITAVLGGIAGLMTAYQYYVPSPETPPTPTTPQSPAINETAPTPTRLTRTITFQISPPQGGNVSFDGSNYGDGGRANKEVGTYVIIAKLAPGYKFSRWEGEGLDIANPISDSTTCTVKDVGYLKMVTEVDEEYRIRQMIEKLFQARDLGWVDEQLKFYTEDASIIFETYNKTSGIRVSTRVPVKEGLYTSPYVEFQNLAIAKLEISANRAGVDCTYIRVGETWYSPEGIPIKMDPVITEKMDLVKDNEAWKIRITAITTTIVS